MADWRQVMNLAEDAKKQMLLHQKKGEKKFDKLLKQFGADGMIFFKRAEAYEAMNENMKANADYRKAMALFPMEKWKSIAREGVHRTAEK